MLYMYLFQILIWSLTNQVEPPKDVFSHSATAIAARLCHVDTIDDFFSPHLGACIT